MLQMCVCVPELMPDTYTLFTKATQSLIFSQLQQIVHGFLEEKKKLAPAL